MSLASITSGSSAGEPCCNGAEMGELSAEYVSWRHADHAVDRSRQDDITRAQRRAEGGELVRQPGNAPGGVSKYGRARAGIDQLSVPGHHHPDEPQVNVGHLALVAPHDQQAG